MQNSFREDEEPQGLGRVSVSSKDGWSRDVEMTGVDSTQASRSPEPWQEKVWEMMWVDSTQAIRSPEPW